MMRLTDGSDSPLESFRFPSVPELCVDVILEAWESDRHKAIWLPPHQRELLGEWQICRGPSSARWCFAEGSVRVVKKFRTKGHGSEEEEDGLSVVVWERSGRRSRKG